MITIHGLSKQYGSKILFEDAEAFLGPRVRVALVGPNGAGKSTLVKMILDQESVDKGEISKANRLVIGHLAQEIPRFGGHTVLEEVMRLDGRRELLLQEKAELESLFAGSTSYTPQQLERYSRVAAEVEGLDEYRLESRARSILAGMGFAERDATRALTEFSGGWLMRVALSRILLLSPDLLLLDEPTNYLDLESLLWLENFLSNSPGAMLLISHDMDFLNRLATEVWDVDQRKIVRYSGNIESFIDQREERLVQLRARFEGQQAKIAEIEKFVSRFGAKASKARQAQSRLKQLDRMERIELPESRDRVEFKFPPAPHSGKEVITLSQTSLRFGERTIFRDLEWVLKKGSRVAIVGVNGAGKTTLLRLLGGHLKPDSGTVKLGHQVHMGYYAQMQSENLQPESTVLEELQNSAPTASIAQIRGVAGAFLFQGDAVFKKCRVLSGGEKARVALAKLLLNPSNLLLLDEPTNHLDVESRHMLLEALKKFDGTLCLVSHDRAFVSPLVDQVLEIIPTSTGSTVNALIGDYEDYLARKTREISEAQMRPSVSGAERSQVPKESKTAKSEPSPNQKRSWERESLKLEEEISKIETQLADIQLKLSDSSTYRAEESATLKDLLEKQNKFQTQLSEKMNRWEEISTLLS